MSMSSSFSSDDSQIEAWVLPDVETAEGPGRGLLTAGQLEEIQKQAYAEGFVQGKKEGYKAGEKRVQQHAEYLYSVIEMLQQPLADLDEAVIKQLVDLATIISRQVIRRELRTDPGQIIGVVRECIKALPVVSRKVSIYLHPDDAMLVRGAFSIDENIEQTWSIVEDPVLTRGGCRVEAENSTIDATVEQQMNRVIANLLGGERERDDS